jgi:YD repeat-containing protein
MRVKWQTTGNGVVTNHIFDAATGRLTGIEVGSGGAIADFSYVYDARGNLKSRAEARTGVSESFDYDELDRLTTATRAASPSPIVKRFGYSPAGKLLSKTDVGNYAYPPAGSARPHAVSSISGGPVPATFGYDANGNQTSGLGRTITYTAADLPASVKQGTRCIATVRLAQIIDFPRRSA